MVKTKMRIAQIAPLYERVPPKLYGGTERIVYALTEELVARGHAVTLIASADSITSANLVPCSETGTRLGGLPDALSLHLSMLEAVYARSAEFDIIHSHVDTIAFWFAKGTSTPTIHTMHGRMDLPDTQRVMRRATDQLLVSISDSQRDPIMHLRLNWLGTVYNGIRIENFPFRPEPDMPPYLVFLGRIAPEKGPLQAIDVARRAGLPLKIAAKIDPADREWAERHFLPGLGTPGIEYLGEVDEVAKAELLGGAYAVLFPTVGREPFGMVMAEALACGTPVIALRGGAVVEVMRDGVTGYVCDSLDEMVSAIGRVEQLDRSACRLHAQTQFSSQLMTTGYERIYEAVLTQSHTSAGKSNGRRQVASALSPLT
jgi:glycosyltransferase involved in cell wall biosynthesis